MANVLQKNARHYCIIYTEVNKEINNSSLQGGETFLIPNTIVLAEGIHKLKDQNKGIPLPELRDGTIRIKNRLEKEGYGIIVIAEAKKDKSLELLSQISSGRLLYGVAYIGHETAGYFSVADEKGEEVRIDKDEIGKELRYKIGLLLNFSCNSLEDVRNWKGIMGAGSTYLGTPRQCSPWETYLLRTPDEESEDD